MCMVVEKVSTSKRNCKLAEHVKLYAVCGSGTSGLGEPLIKNVPSAESVLSGFRASDFETPETPLSPSCVSRSNMMPWMFNPFLSLAGVFIASSSTCSSRFINAGGRCRIARAFAREIVFCWYVVVTDFESSRSMVAFMRAAIQRRPCLIFGTAK